MARSRGGGGPARIGDAPCAHHRAGGAGEDGLGGRNARARAPRSPFVGPNALFAHPGGRRMTLVIEILLATLGAPLLVPAAVLFVECLAALLPDRTAKTTMEHVPENRVVVLIPACDEGRVLKRT